MLRTGHQLAEEGEALVQLHLLPLEHHLPSVPIALENVVLERGRDPLPPAGGKKGGRGQSKSRDAIASLDGSTCVLEEVMGDVKDRLSFVEQNHQTLEDHVLEELESLKKVVTGQDELRTRFMELFANLQEQLDVVKVGVEETRQETAICKRAIAGGAIITPSPRVDVPKPKEFGGKRDAKELDNFIWHMERYFEGASIMDKKAKVRTATLYLTDTATLWWRRKHNDIEKGLCAIDTWDVFKKEIKRQFYPENVTYEARKKLRELKHKSSITNYYRQFIKDYSTKGASLMDLLKKGKTSEWSKRCQTAFEGLKEAVMEEPVLAFPDHTKVFEVQTDASDFAIGAKMLGHNPCDPPAKAPPEFTPKVPEFRPSKLPEMPQRPNVPDFDPIPPKKTAAPPPLSPGPVPDFPGLPVPSPPGPDMPRPPSPQPGPDVPRPPMPQVAWSRHASSPAHAFADGP
ncbi:hypothetical protein RJ639_009898 [Escallonia herrerae]|uniref:Retrotransposon gag domain-containing protein n=1 Tax=Escallonia herrerae TaxID=1293975 RepID=A0AA89ASG7_9ASTE|nr:hypothetical protein RJ639_009898 [Escallonia herrerae]